MVKLQETWTKEKAITYVISIHCRECNTQIGFFNDVTIQNQLWMMLHAGLFNFQHTTQVVVCQKCTGAVAVQRVQSNSRDWTHFEVIREKVILKHCNS